MESKKNKSSVWQYFSIDESKEKTTCNLCQEKLAYKSSSTTNMRNHIQRKHKSINLDSPSAPGTSSPVPKQAALSGFVKKIQMSRLQQETATRRLEMMCAVDLRPVSICEGPGFRYFCNELNPGYKVPCRKTVTSYIHKIYEEEKVALIDELSGCAVALTSDLWTSTAVQGYVTLTGHHLTPDWKLKANVLATRNMDERHTGCNIANEIKLLLQEFRIAVTPGLTTDNAANMDVAATELNIPHVHCFSHTIQLAVNDGLKIPQIARVIGAARKLVAHFNYSSVATTALLKKQEGRVNPPLKLIQDVPTRWNSSYYMLDRLLKLRGDVYNVIFDDTVTKSGDRARLDLRDSFFKVMEEILPVLEPMEEVTEVLGKEDTPTGSAVYVLIHNLVSEKLWCDDSVTGVRRELSLKMKEGLQKRFLVDRHGVPTMECILQSPLLLATLLDPRYKGVILNKILSEEKGNALKNRILHLLTELFDENNQNASVQEDTASDESQEPAPKRARISDILKGDVIESSTVSSPLNELNEYLAEPVRTLDPLEWWNMFSAKFPTISKLAKQYLAIPATSVPSERSFSAAGLTITKLRANLDPDTVDHITFLHKKKRSEILDYIKKLKD